MSSQARIYNAKTITGLGNQSGQFNSDLTPSVDNSYFLGAAALRWKIMHTVSAVVSEGLQVGGLTQLSDTVVGGDFTVSAGAAPNSGKAYIGMMGDETDHYLQDLNPTATSQDLIAPRIEASAWLTAPLISVMGYAVADQFVGTRTTDTTSSIDTAAGARFDGGMAVAKRIWASNLQADNEVRCASLNGVTGYIVGSTTGGVTSFKVEKPVGNTTGITSQVRALDPSFVGDVLAVETASATNGNANVIVARANGADCFGVKANKTAFFNGFTSFNSGTYFYDDSEGSPSGTGSIGMAGGIYINKNLHAGSSGKFLGNNAINNITFTAEVPSDTGIGLYGVANSASYSGSVLLAEAPNSTNSSANLILARSNGINRFQVRADGYVKVTGDMRVDGDFSSGTGSATYDNALITSTVETTSPDTGALKVSGGVGIAKSLNIGKDLFVYNTANVTNSSTSFDGASLLRVENTKSTFTGTAFQLTNLTSATNFKLINYDDSVGSKFRVDGTGSLTSTGILNNGNYTSSGTVTTSKLIASGTGVNDNYISLSNTNVNNVGTYITIQQSSASGTVKYLDFFTNGVSTFSVTSGSVACKSITNTGNYSGQAITATIVTSPLITVTDLTATTMYAGSGNFRVLSSGNVSIGGTVNPSERLVITGNATVSGTVTASDINVSTLRFNGDGIPLKQTGTVTGSSSQNVGVVVPAGRAGVITAYKNTDANEAACANFRADSSNIIFYNINQNVLTLSNSGRQLRVDCGFGNTYVWTIIIY